MPGLWSFKSQTDLYEFKKVSDALLLSSFPPDVRFSVKINANMYHALARLVIIYHILLARSTNPHLLIFDGKNDAKVR